MQINRLIILFIIFILSACGNSDLKAENENLKKQIVSLNENIDKHISDIEYADRQASIAAGCDFLIPMCPTKAISSGRKYLAQGYGGAGWPMWLIAAIKVAALAALGSIVGGAFSGAFSLFWITWGAPAASNVEKARQMIDEQNELVERAEKRRIDAETRELAARKRLDAAQEATQEAIKRASEAEQAAIDAESRAAHANALKSALSAFD